MEAPDPPRLQDTPEQPKRPFGPGLRLGRIFGLDLRVDGSWLIVFALVAVSMAGYFRQGFPDPPTLQIWAVALGTSLTFFASLLLHEISHSLVARAKGLHVHGITLFLFGGVSELREEPRRASDEFLIALVGPLASVAAGLFFFTIQALFPSASLGDAALGWLGRINLVLAVFNLLPGLPLDGGRMLRAAVWGATRDLRRATAVASTLGAGIAIALIGWGVVDVLWRSRLVEGLWLALIGWFLLGASRRNAGPREPRAILQRLRVEQAMRTSCPRVSPLLPVERLADEPGATCFLVADDDVLRGLLSLEQLQRLPPDERPTSSVSDIMTPFHRLTPLAPRDSLLVALERMDERAVRELPVVEKGRVTGVLTRDDIAEFVSRS